MNPAVRQAKPAVEKAVFYAWRMDCKNWYVLLGSGMWLRKLEHGKRVRVKERVSVYRLHVGQ